MTNRNRHACALVCAALVVALALSRAWSQQALWLSENWGILRLNTVDGAVLFEVLQSNGGGSIYVEPDTGNIWSFSAATLYEYSPDGTLLLSALTPFDPTDPVHGFAVDESAGNVWVGLRKKVHRLNLSGGVVGSRTLATRIRGMVVDRTTSNVWVAEEHVIRVYAPITVTGDPVNLVHTIDRGQEIVKDLAFDPGIGEMWVATDAHVLRYTPGFSLTFDSAAALAAKREFLVIDGLGGVWGANNHTVAHMTGAGVEDLVFRPFQDQTDDTIVGLDSDPPGNTLWVANSTLVRQYSSAGQMLREFIPDVGDGVIRTLQKLKLGTATATPPTLTIMEPLDGALINDNRPSIVLEAVDGGNGIDEDSLEILANGILSDQSCTFALPAITCVPTAPFFDGVVTLTATIADELGSASAPAEIEFTVDTVAPIVTVTAPPDGDFTNESATTINGSISESATLTINGQSVPVEPTNLFSFATSLEEGANSFSLSATDSAGNSSARGLVINLDTAAPAAADPTSISVGAPVGGVVTVSGQASAVEPNAFVRITNVDTGESVVVIAAADGSFSADIAAATTDTLEIEVEDAAGNVGQTISVGGTFGPPVVDPALFAQAEAQGFIEVEIIPRLRACPQSPTASSLRTLDLIANRLLSKSLIVRNEIFVDANGCVSLTVLPRGLEILAEDVRLAEIVGAD